MTVQEVMKTPKEIIEQHWPESFQLTHWQFTMIEYCIEKYAAQFKNQDNKQETKSYSDEYQGPLVGNHIPNLYENYYDGRTDRNEKP